MILETKAWRLSIDSRIRLKVWCDDFLARLLGGRDQVTYEEFRLAVRAFKRLAQQVGPGWVITVWEPASELTPVVTAGGDGRRRPETR